MSTILLVDDDVLLRDTVRQLLELDGHQVIDVADGAAGQQYLARHASSVNLVITDMLMPVMDGAQFIVHLKQTHPRLPVIAISGGRRTLSPQFNLDTANLLGVAKSLPKPFGREALQAAVRSVLPP
ncbi:response regulator [Sphaerotilus sp.]|uniref:response regulator n=1 Tax=Sphaerotilus sp. TaxID=2093942 RepID=UPI002ACDA377|nr:response regulator [Sphaerotilus sp.]MDZ7854743.1 response regulator [Sphaerotilus sp.]